MNPALNKQLYGLLNKTGLTSQKAALVAGFTNGRSESTKDLTNDEARQMIRFLNDTIGNQDISSNKMRRSIIAMAHEMGWHIPDTSKINMDSINNWCLKYSYLKKPLNSYTHAELPKLVTQFTGVYKSFLMKL